MSVFMKWIRGSAAIGGAMLIGSSLPASAGYVVTLEQVGNDVVATGSGPIDPSTVLGPPHLGFASTSVIGPAIGNIGTRAIPVVTEEDVPLDLYFSFNITGPLSFGSDINGTTANASTGDFVGLEYGPVHSGGQPALVVPRGYVPNAPLSDTAIYVNRTFDSLGVTPGTYEWAWGTGANQNFTLQIGPAAAVPEPSSLLLLGGVLAGLLVVRSRRRDGTTR
jgi:PEP-CTERM motif